MKRFLAILCVAILSMGLMQSPATAVPEPGEETPEKAIYITRPVKVGCVIVVAVHNFSATAGNIVFTVNSVVQHVIPGQDGSFQTSFEHALKPGSYTLTATQFGFSASVSMNVLIPDWWNPGPTASPEPIDDPWITPGEVFDQHPPEDGWELGSIFHGNERIDIYCIERAGNIWECEYYWWVWVNGRWVLLGKWRDYVDTGRGGDDSGVGGGVGGDGGGDNASYTPRELAVMAGWYFDETKPIDC